MTIQQKNNEAEEALKQWGIEYTKRNDGAIVVKTDLNISYNGMNKLPDLTSVIVEGNFLCHYNQLTSLTGAPASVGGNFWCYGNELTSLEGASLSVGGSFLCHDNQLTSLTGAPTSIGMDFLCHHNQLTSLEGCPPNFKKLYSDFGEFTSWREVPEDLRTSPETKEKMRLEKLRKIGEASVQKQPFKPSPSIRFKAGPK